MTQLTPIDVLDLGLGMFLEKLLDSFKSGFSLETHLRVDLFARVAFSELVIEYRGVGAEV